MVDILVNRAWYHPLFWRTTWSSDPTHGNATSYVWYILYDTLNCEDTGHGYYVVQVRFLRYLCPNLWRYNKIWMSNQPIPCRAIWSSLCHWHHSFPLSADKVWVFPFWNMFSLGISILESTLQRNTKRCCVRHQNWCLNIIMYHFSWISIKGWSTH